MQRQSFPKSEHSFQNCRRICILIFIIIFIFVPTFILPFCLFRNSSSDQLASMCDKLDPCAIVGALPICLLSPFLALTCAKRIQCHPPPQSYCPFIHLRTPISFQNHCSCLPPRPVSVLQELTQSSSFLESFYHPSTHTKDIS